MINDRTLIQIRERSFLDLLDLSLYVVRARPVELGAAALAGIAPWAVINYRVLEEPGFPAWAWLLLLLFEAPWATAPICLVLGELMFLNPQDYRRTGRTLLRSIPAMILGHVLLRAVAALSVILYPAMPAQYAFLSEVILLERSDARDLGTRLTGLFKRCRELSKGFEGELLMRWFAQLALGGIFAVCFWMCAKSLGSTLIGEELTWYRPGMNDLGGILFQASVWIAVAFFAVYRYFAYVDRRIRLQGWELGMRLKAAARGLERSIRA
jgi:hypothetical protein